MMSMHIAYIAEPIAAGNIAKAMDSCVPLVVRILKNARSF